MINVRQLPRKPQPDKPHPRLTHEAERTKAVTVCIAAICQGIFRGEFEGFFWEDPAKPEFIVGISDRMLSIPRFAQYESSKPKFSKIVNS